VLPPNSVASLKTQDDSETKKKDRRRGPDDGWN